MSADLKSCPLCGSAFKMGQEPRDNHPVGGKFYIYHDYGPLDSAARKCPIEVPRHFDTEAEAITAWNTRAPLPATQEDAERSGAGEPVAYLHTLHMEGGQTYDRLTLFNGIDPDDSRVTAFGVPGRDYSEEYSVSTTPLYALSTPQRQEYDGEAVREALVNAKYALEYWERESKAWSDSRVPGARPGWMAETRRRGREEIARIDRRLAALAHPAQARDEMREALVLPGQIPPFLSASDFDDRSEERVCINGCLYLRADFAAQRFAALSSDKGEER